MFLDKDLQNSYDLVGDKIYSANSLNEKSLKQSIDLFTEKSLLERNPKPIDVEVFTLVSGLPFTNDLTSALQNIIKKISKTLEQTLCYWVKPENYGVEYCVFKWPTDTLERQRIDEIKLFLNSSNYNSFELKVIGIQLHQDGCLVAKGFDNGRIRAIRSDLKSNLKFLPKKQSNWAHIPLGRILEPVSGDMFRKLKDEIKNLSYENIGTEKIIDTKLVYETRWYMEKRKILLNKNFIL